MKEIIKDADYSLIRNKLYFMKEVCKHIKEIDNIAAFASKIIYDTIKTDKIAVAIIYGNILRSLNSIGERNFIDLNLTHPSVNLRTINTKKTQIVHDTRIDPDYFPGTAYGIEIRSELCVPLIYKREVLGTINLESRHERNFSDRDAFIAELFAEELAKILHRVLSSDNEPSIFERHKIRSKNDMYVDILSTIVSGEKIPTHILNSVNISWKSGKKLLDDLQEKGLIEVEQVSPLRKRYQATNKGKQVLEEYKTLISILT